MSEQPLITRDPEILSGTPVFAGTRVPARTLVDYLEAGHNLNEFLDDFPTVRREQAEAALELFKRSLLEQPYESAA
jgi:uncharacterized protein (DUF433 family)